MAATSTSSRNTFTAARDRSGYTPISPSSIVTWHDVRTGHAEIRACRSLDGVWLYARHEDTGTTWTVTHLPTGRTLDLAATSLPQARRDTFDGTTLRLLDTVPAPSCGWVSPWGTGSRCSDPAVADERCDRHGLVSA